VELQGNYKEMDELRQQEENRQQKLRKARDELSAAELDLESLNPYVPPTDEIVSVHFSHWLYYLYLSTVKRMFFLESAIKGCLHPYVFS
jgi:hypothetical protein